MLRCKHGICFRIKSEFLSDVLLYYHSFSRTFDKAYWHQLLDLWRCHKKQKPFFSTTCRRFPLGLDGRTCTSLTFFKSELRSTTFYLPICVFFKQTDLFFFNKNVGFQMDRTPCMYLDHASEQCQPQMTYERTWPPLTVGQMTDKSTVHQIAVWHKLIYPKSIFFFKYQWTAPMLSFSF